MALSMEPGLGSSRRADGRVSHEGRENLQLHANFSAADRRTICKERGERPRRSGRECPTLAGWYLGCADRAARPEPEHRPMPPWPRTQPAQGQRTSSLSAGTFDRRGARWTSTGCAGRHRSPAQREVGFSRRGRRSTATRSIGDGGAREPRVLNGRHAEAEMATDLREQSRIPADFPYIFRTSSRCANKFDAKWLILLARPTGIEPVFSP